MPAKLSTHVLDTANGCPAGGMKVELFAQSEDGSYALLKSLVTNSDGRNSDGPILDEKEMKEGKFELRFHVGDYFKARAEAEKGAGAPAPNAGPTGVLFLDVVPIQFGIPDATQGYHVPLLCSPWSYSTYRGS